jgi:hypothetical protein
MRNGSRKAQNSQNQSRARQEAVNVSNRTLSKSLLQLLCRRGGGD